MIQPSPVIFPKGGRHLPAPEPINERTPVRLTYPYDKRADRYVQTTTLRLHASVVYAVAVTDGNGCLTTEAPKPSLHTTPASARKAHQAAVRRWGGVAHKPTVPNLEDPEDAALRKTLETRKANGTLYKTGRMPKPKRVPSGWLAEFTHHKKPYRATFKTKKEAEQYIHQVKEG